MIMINEHDYDAYIIVFLPNKRALNHLIAHNTKSYIRPLITNTYSTYSY